MTTTSPAFGENGSPPPIERRPEPPWRYRIARLEEMVEGQRRDATILNEKVARLGARVELLEGLIRGMTDADARR